MNKQKLLKTVRRTLYVVVTIYALLLAWQIAYWVCDNPLLVPSVGQTLARVCELFGSANFYGAFGMTLLRAVLAFCIAVALALVLFACSKTCEFMKTFCDVLVKVLRSAPTIAIILFILLLTNSQVAPIFVAVLVVTPIIYAGMCGFSVGNDVKKVCYLYKISKKDYIKFVYIPKLQREVLPIFSSSIALNLKIVVASEVLANTYKSLGGLMQESKVYFDMAGLIALALVTVVVAGVLEWCVGACKFFKFKVK